MHDIVYSVTSTCIRRWNKPSCLYSPAAQHHRSLAGAHFLSRWGQEAELASVAGYIPRWFARPNTVTNPSTNQAQRIEQPRAAVGMRIPMGIPNGYGFPMGIGMRWYGDSDESPWACGDFMGILNGC